MGFNRYPSNWIGTAALGLGTLADTLRYADQSDQREQANQIAAANLKMKAVEFQQQQEEYERKTKLRPWTVYTTDENAPESKFLADTAVKAGFAQMVNGVPHISEVGKEGFGKWVQQDADTLKKLTEMTQSRAQAEIDNFNIKIEEARAKGKTDEEIKDLLGGRERALTIRRHSADARSDLDRYTQQQETYKKLSENVIAPVSRIQTQFANNEISSEDAMVELEKIAKVEGQLSGATPYVDKVRSSIQKPEEEFKTVGIGRKNIGVLYNKKDGTMRRAYLDDNGKQIPIEAEKDKPTQDGGVNPKHEKIDRFHRTESHKFAMSMVKLDPDTQWAIDPTTGVMTIAGGSREQMEEYQRYYDQKYNELTKSAIRRGYLPKDWIQEEEKIPPEEQKIKTGSAHEDTIKPEIVKQFTDWLDKSSTVEEAGKKIDQMINEYRMSKEDIAEVMNKSKWTKQLLRQEEERKKAQSSRNIRQSELGGGVNPIKK